MFRAFHILLQYFSQSEENTADEWGLFSGHAGTEPHSSDTACIWISAVLHVQTGRIISPWEEAALHAEEITGAGGISAY